MLIRLAERCRLIPLLGNHEEVLLEAFREKDALRRWLTLGGADTLRSYGWVPGGPRRALADWFPKPHREFIAGCRGFRAAQTRPRRNVTGQDRTRICFRAYPACSKRQSPPPRRGATAAWSVRKCSANIG
jgi:hypothetical protein